MLYTDQVKRAMDLAYRAHLGQTDKGGAPYIFHPIHLAEQMDTETEITAALLHDVVEDTALTLPDLREAGISDEVLAVLDLLTHRPGEPYMDYIRRLAPDPVARKIKLADLRHNGDMTRLGPEDQEKVCYFQKKYAPAVAYLMEFPK
jgi:(p)ppGpp synthase/HD superfamily hydrolase